MKVTLNIERNSTNCFPIQTKAQKWLHTLPNSSNPSTSKIMNLTPQIEGKMFLLYRMHESRTYCFHFLTEYKYFRQVNGMHVDFKVRATGLTCPYGN